MPKINYQGKELEVIETKKASKSNDPRVKEAYICADSSGARIVVLDIEVMNGQGNSQDAGQKTSAASGSKRVHSGKVSKLKS